MDRRSGGARRARRRTLFAAALGLALGLLAPSRARADDDADWYRRYEVARQDLIEGRPRPAEAEFARLAASARSESQRITAREMARLAAAEAERAERPVGSATLRSTDELTLLYGSAFVYGVGTGAWFLLQTRPDSALTATLPFAALAAAPIVAVATIDGTRRFRRGIPHALSAGLVLGVGEAAWIVGFQHARASRLDDADPRSDARWSPEMTATVLWGGATLGATLGGALASAVVTTPGRVSFTTSTTAWAGTLSGLLAGAFLPDDDHRRERAFAIGGIGYNAGLVGGLLGAGSLSPSVARVRLVDLLGLGGGLVASGVYLSTAIGRDVREAEGIGAIGIGTGLAAGWLLTSGMPRERAPGEPAPPPRLSLHPAITPVPAGLTLGVRGAL